MIKNSTLLSQAKKKIPNRFLLINVISKRVRQYKKDNPISGSHNISFVDNAIKELVKGKIKVEFKEKTKKEKKEKK